MSWSIKLDKTKGTEALHTVEAATLPRSIKDYILAGVAGQIAKHGEEVVVTVDGHGHLHDPANKDSYDVTSATLEVRGVIDDAAAEAAPTEPRTDAKE